MTTGAGKRGDRDNEGRASTLNINIDCANGTESLKKEEMKTKKQVEVKRDDGNQGISRVPLGRRKVQALKCTLRVGGLELGMLGEKGSRPDWR